MSEPIDRPSPNHDERRRPISMIVLHYTDMLSAEEAIARLCDPEAGVSCHYLVTKAGEVVRMVPEERRAWHAGRSYWRGITDVNDDSIGIELDNPVTPTATNPFPTAQIDALIPLCPTSCSATTSPAATWSAIPTSRPPASATPASSSPGQARAPALALAAADPQFDGPAMDRRRVSCWRWSGSAMTSAIRWRRSWPSSAASAPS
jgi:hypothetical protein